MRTGQDHSEAIRSLVLEKGRLSLRRGLAGSGRGGDRRLAIFRSDSVAAGLCLTIRAHALLVREYCGSPRLDLLQFIHDFSGILITRLWGQNLNQLFFFLLLLQCLFFLRRQVLALIDRLLNSFQILRIAHVIDQRDSLTSLHLLDRFFFEAYTYVRVHSRQDGGLPHQCWSGCLLHILIALLRIRRFAVSDPVMPAGHHQVQTILANAHRRRQISDLQHFAEPAHYRISEPRE